MSSASNQALRAGIRESNGTGSSVAAPRNANSANLPLPRLQPSDESIIAQISKKTIANKERKFDIFKNVYNNKAALAAHLESLSAGSSAQLNSINWNDHNSKLKAKSNYSAPFLAQAIADIRQSLQPILPPSVNHTGLLASLKPVVAAVDTLYNQAQHVAATELESEFSSQVLTLSGPDASRRYLVDGYRPTIPGVEICMICGDGYIDEPNSNRVKAQRNQTKQAQYQSEAAADEAAWSRGEVVRNNKGEVMKEGRKRPEPKYKQLLLQCYCDEFGCTTGEGDVPTDQCPIKCIDPQTGKRYELDQNHNCLCPLCRCPCKAAYTVSIDRSHYFYYTIT